MQLDPDGAEHLPALLDTTGLKGLAAAVSGDESRRLDATSGVAALVAPATAAVRRRLPGAQPVFAKFFDKSPERNWSLGWHQDRTIAVQERRDTPGFNHWTVKDGLTHAVPPVAFLESLLVLRLHLDPADADNAPLLVAPGSRRLGRVPEPDIAAAVARCGTCACLAEAGDAWLYRALILHASERARRASRRRVLQLAYSAEKLPGELEWLGI